MHGFDDLTATRYVSLATFRTNGERVATPVWFVVIEGRGFVYTGETAGKVKRIRNDRRVQVAACSIRGTVKEAYRSASARVLDAGEVDPVRAAFAAKYGVQWRFVTWRNERKGGSSVFVEVVPDGEDE